MRWLDDFSWCEHKINNTGWIWNGDEREGWNEAKPKGNAERFFNLHFLDQKWSKDLEFCTCKTERTLQISGKCVQNIQSCLRTPPSYFKHENKAEKSMQWGESSFKRAQRYLNIKYGEVSLQIEFTTLPPKPQPLYEMRWKRKQEEQGKMQSD